MKPDPDEGRWRQIAWQDFDDEAFESLKTTETAKTPDAAIDDAEEAARKQAKQKHDQREKLFGTVRWCLVCTLMASAAIMGFYMWSQWGQISSEVMISWNVAIVVNTVGLAYIVANYLFSDNQA